jgi:hypothetical protein
MYTVVTYFLNRFLVLYATQGLVLENGLLNLIYVLRDSLFVIHYQTILHLHICFPSDFFSQVFPAELRHEFLIAPMRSTCHACLILFNLTTLTHLL